MKIHFFALNLNTVSGGGSHHTLDYILRTLKKRGHDITLTTLFSDGNRFARPPEFTLLETQISGSFLEQQKKISSILSQTPADLFFLYGPSIFWAGGMYRKSGGTTPTVAYLNNYTPGMRLFHRDYREINFFHRAKKYIRDLTFSYKSYVWEKLQGATYVRYLDALISDSPIVEKIYKDFGYTARHSFVCPEFIETTTESLRLPSNQVAPFNKNPNTLHILYTGRLMYDKGIDLLIHALTQGTPPHIITHLVGEGPQKKYLQFLTKKYGLQNILFYDWMDQEKLVGFYKHADIFIHPCRWPEPFGRTIVEAMSQGLPIITTAHSGSAWVAGKAGYILSNTTPGAIRKMLIDIYSDKEGLEKKSLEARERAKIFDPQKQLSNLETFLHNLPPTNTAKNG